MSVRRSRSNWVHVKLAALVTPCLMVACQSTAPRDTPVMNGTTSPITTTGFQPGPSPRVSKLPEVARPAPQVSGNTHPDEWQFHLGLYFWGAAMNGVASAGFVGVPINESFSEILDHLRFAGMGAFEAKRRQWGVRLDGMYMDLEGSSAGLTGTVNTQLETLIAEADILFSPRGEPSLDFIAGVRVLGLETEVDFPIAPTQSGKTTEIDPIIGAQGTWDLGETWKFRLRGDVGGFGASSELTYQFLGFFRWAFAEAWGLDFGYRLIGYSIDQGNIDLDAQFQGLILGVDYAF